LGVFAEFETNLRRERQPLGERKVKLAHLVDRKLTGIVMNEHTDEDGATGFRHACKLGLEGTVSKRLAAPYRLA
jgi:bifunctional non-homologous end joining protein LigD